MARDRAIMVIILRDMPMSFMMRKEDMTEMGSVSPVITVERQELMNRKTMKMVKIAPRIKVWRTSSSDSRIKTDPSRTMESVVCGGISFCNSAAVVLTASTTS